MGFYSRWAFPTLGMTVLSGTEALPGSTQHGHPEGWKCPSTTEPHFLHNTTEKLKRIYVVCLAKNTRVRTGFLSQA